MGTSPGHSSSTAKVNNVHIHLCRFLERSSIRIAGLQVTTIPV